MTTSKAVARSDSAASDATKERIAATALHILERDGPDAVSMRRVATAVGVTPMAIYHYFPNREALLSSIVDNEFGALLQFITRTPKFRSLESEMTHIMDSYIDYAFARPHIFDYVFAKPRSDARRFPHDFRARRSPTLNPIADTVARWMQRGDIKQDDVWETALQIWAHAHGYLMLQRAGRFDLSPLAFKKLLHRSLKRLLYGLKG
jgi:AcrR family transcriptional regulator